jgi:hypothetical protein
MPLEDELVSADAQPHESGFKTSFARMSTALTNF